MSWGELLVESTQRLIGRVEDPEVSARRIVEEASGAEGADLHGMLERAATVRGVARLDAMVARRSAGEPLQYVLGRWAFRHLDLMVDRRVLIPRPETEIVAGHALAELHRFEADRGPLATGDLVAVDLGTGSGAIGLSLAREHPRAQVWLSDRSADALAVARANLAGLGRHGSRVQIVEGSWFEPFSPDLQGRFAVVVSNPPYVGTADALPPQVAKWEPGEALFAGPDGTDDLWDLIDTAPRWLAPAGALVLEMAPGQTRPAAERARQWSNDVVVFDDLTGRARGIVARLA